MNQKRPDSHRMAALLYWHRLRVAFCADRAAHAAQLGYEILRGFVTCARGPENSFHSLDWSGTLEQQPRCSKNARLVVKSEQVK